MCLPQVRIRILKVVAFLFCHARSPARPVPRTEYARIGTHRAHDVPLNCVDVARRSHDFLPAIVSQFESMIGIAICQLAIILPEAAYVLLYLEQIILVDAVHLHVFLRLVDEPGDQPLDDVHVG